MQKKEEIQPPGQNPEMVPPPSPGVFPEKSSPEIGPRSPDPEIYPEPSPQISPEQLPSEAPLG